MYRGMIVGVVVPAYNEEGYVGSVIDGLPSFIDRAYVIDDGSTDGTWDEILRHAEKRNETHTGEFDDLVVPIQHQSNKGVGGAIKTGYRRALEEEIDATAVLGGDDQMNPSELPRYFDPIANGDADYVKGNRFTQASNWEEMPRFRFIGNVILSYLTKIASGYWNIMDSQNGYTVISKRALDEADIEGMYEYYGYCNDLLVRLNAANLRVADIPRSSEYSYTEGWKSHIEYNEYIPRVSAMLIRSFLWRLRHKYLLTGYHVTAPLYAVGITGLVGSLLGLVKSLLSRGRDGTAVWFLTLFVSVITTLTAAELDHRKNEQLGIQLTEEDLGEVNTDDTPAEEGQSTGEDTSRPVSEQTTHDTQTTSAQQEKGGEQRPYSARGNQ